MNIKTLSDLVSKSSNIIPSSFSNLFSTSFSLSEYSSSTLFTLSDIFLNSVFNFKLYFFQFCNFSFQICIYLRVSSLFVSAVSIYESLWSKVLTWLQMLSIICWNCSIFLSGFYPDICHHNQQYSLSKISHFVMLGLLVIIIHQGYIN